ARTEKYHAGRLLETGEDRSYVKIRVDHRRSFRRRQRGRVDRQRAKKPMLFVGDTSRKEQRAGRGVSHAETELQRPDSWNVDRRVGGVADLTEEVARVEVERVDRAVTEVADKQSVVELRESLERGPCHPPRRVELAVASE